MALFNAPIVFWIMAIAMTLLSVAAIVWPLLGVRRKNVDVSFANEGTQRVLIDQLDEIKRDHKNGFLNKEEAESARAEVARRLLILDRETEAGDDTVTKQSRLYLWGVIALVPVLTIGFYASLGAPHLPDQPISTRLAVPDEEQNPGVMIARIEGHLLQNPDDLRGWLALAPIYHSSGQLGKAEDAYRRILSIGLPEVTADEKEVLGKVQNGLGQILTVKADGQVSVEALGLFQEAKTNAPQDPTSYFFEALALTQAKRRDQAIPAWEMLIARFGEDNPPWLKIAEQTLAHLKNPPETAPGPNAEEIEAARNLSPEERAEFVESMVARLAEKLKQEPQNMAGWNRLVQSYMVLGKKDEAIDALKRARLAMNDNPEAKTLFDVTASELGL